MMQSTNRKRYIKKQSIIEVQQQETKNEKKKKKYILKQDLVNATDIQQKKQSKQQELIHIKTKRYVLKQQFNNHKINKDIHETQKDKNIQRQSRYIKVQKDEETQKKIINERAQHQKNKQKYSHNSNQPCQKYFKESYIIQNDLHSLGDHIKKLKKMFIAEFKEAQDIKIYASKSTPMIYFDFLQSTLQQRKQIHLRELLKKIKDFHEKRYLFEQIFGRIFKKVPKKFHNLFVFGVQKADQIRIKGFNKFGIFNLEQGNEVMFYYLEGKHKNINFTIGDKRLRLIEFNSKLIEKYNKDHPKQFQSYIKFKQQLFQTNRQGLGINLLDNQQLQSDEDDKIDFQEKSIIELKNSIQQIIKKNLNQLQQIIQKKYQQMISESQKDSESVACKKLADQHEDLVQNRQNFIQTRNLIRQKLKSNSEDKCLLKIYLKKLIIAEKQLQSKLPIITKKKYIFQMLKNQNLIIIQGQTGSGKSTQLPQMLCQYYNLLDNKTVKPVLVTQPRRLATRTLAERVAKQMGQQVGGFVDYVASAGRKASMNAKIIFKLDRLVLDEMTIDSILSNYSCLVIDQAHQRTISIDVILGLVKELLQKRKDFKVIVTSASMDVRLFENYFLTKTLKVSGRTYPVTITYKIYDKYKEGDKNQILHKISRVIDQQILIDNSNLKSQFKGHLLCFCSSLNQINQLVKIYTAKLNLRVFDVFPLHGKVTPADQKKVFQDTGKYKFIFASRIAETAITIDGVRVVIDPGEDIELVFDQKYKVSSMKLKQITQSSAKQRAGRSGRTGPGHCFRLYSQESFKKRPKNKISQINNSSLETVVLRLKTLRIHNVLAFPFIEKPDIQSLKRSIQLLTLIGALEPKSQKVTNIGKLLIKLPIEPFLSRAIIEGIIFDKILSRDNFSNKIDKMDNKELKLTKQRGVRKTVTEIIALIINFSNLFLIPKDDRHKAEEAKYYQFSDQQGDFFFLDNIYQRYILLKGDQPITSKKKYNYQLKQWIRNNYLNFRALNQINELINDINIIVDEYEVNQFELEDEFDDVKVKIMKCATFRQVILSCLITSFSANLCKYSGNLEVGYTIVNQQRPIQIYGTSNLSLLGIKSDWIICYDLYTNEEGRLFCKLAHKIQYNFMNDHISRYIWKKFEIKEMQQNNPFYQQISRQLPTRYLQQVKFDIKKVDTDNQFNFLKDLFPVINQDFNKVSFFIRKTKKSNELQKIKIKQKQIFIDSYLKKLRNESRLPFRHNYIGNIFIELDHGFKVKQIQFQNKQFCYEIIVPNNQIVAVIEQDSQTWGTSIVEDIRTTEQNNKFKRYNKSRDKETVARVLKKKIKVYIAQQSNIKMFAEYLLMMKQNYPKYFIQYKQTLVDRRRKVPQTKIVLHYFAGTCKQNKALLTYYQPSESENDDNSSDNALSTASIQLTIIKKGLMKKKRERTSLVKMEPSQMHLTKRQNGINIYKCKYDEYQITEELYNMEREGYFQHDFKLPNNIRKFREPVIFEASKYDQQWIEEIQQLLDKINIKRQNIAINIYGYKAEKRGQQNEGEFEKKLRVNMTATITTLDSSIYQKIKNAYDGRSHILGCQKLHVRASYEQIIVVIAQKAFQALYQQYKQYLIDYKINYPFMSFETIYIKTRKKSKIMIKGKSPNKDDFVIPQRQIGSLFSSKFIKLQYSQFKFIDKTDAGHIILETIQEYFNFKIYFGLSRTNYCLKVYCEDNDLKQIQRMIKQGIQQCKFYSEEISYRGKNLNKVKQLLNKQKKNLDKGEELAYQIKFQTRRIQVTADLITFNRVKDKIQKLSISEKGECTICADSMRTPYRLINCKECSFCWLCITEHIREFRNNPKEELQCPNQSCKKLINVHDVRTLLSQEQFQKICDIKISKCVAKNGDKYVGCKYCQNIFDKNEIDQLKEINCQICGKTQCLRCKESHPGWRCDEWKYRNDLPRTLQVLGVKQCPKCKNGIEKNKGCNHMSCKICKSHFCWKCLELFKSEDQCNNHLVKMHGGIFDANYQD